jgi:hypothetical protein
MAIPTRKFLDILRRSKLVDDAPLKKSLRLCIEENGGVLPKDVEQLSDFLIAQNVITNWQSKKLLDRKYKGFFLGKYKLLGHIGVGGMCLPSRTYADETVACDQSVASRSRR